MRREGKGREEKEGKVRKGKGKEGKVECRKVEHQKAKAEVRDNTRFKFPIQISPYIAANIYKPPPPTSSLHTCIYAITTTGLITINFRIPVRCVCEIECFFLACMNMN